jgi:hypothetical protein
LVGARGQRELDGGLLMELCYITKETDPYMLPSVDIEHLLNDEASMRIYFEGAL